MGVAKVDEMGLGLEDLNDEKLDELRELQLFEWLEVPQMTLDAGADLVLVFDGDPTQVETAIFLDRPDLVDHELFFFAETRAGETIIGNYSLLGTAPVTGVPEPSTVVMLLGVGLAGLVASARRRRKR